MSEGASAGRPRPAVFDLPPYRAGRTAQEVALQHGLARAIKLASNETPFGPLPSVEKAIGEAAFSVNRYPDPRTARLRAALSERRGVDPDWITTAAGSVMLLFQFALAFVDPDDEVVFPWRSFEAYPILTRLPGGQAVTVPLRLGTANLPALPPAVTERTKLVIVAEPNNPTGTCAGIEAIETLARALPPSCVLIVDGAYEEFRTGSARFELARLVQDHPNVAVLGTFSKAYGLAGLRIGYAIARPEVIDVVDRVAVPFAVNAIGEAAALASLEASDELEQRVRGVVAERRRVEQALRHNGWAVPESEANFVWLPAGAAAAPLTAALEQRGIVARGFADSGIRVTSSEPDENDAFIAAFLESADADVAAAWEMATGPVATAAGHWLDDAVATGASADDRRYLAAASPSDFAAAGITPANADQWSATTAVEALRSINPPHP